MKDRARKPPAKKQPRSYKPRPKRVSMGELHYFALTLRGLLHNVCRNEELRHHILEDIKAHCPTLFQAMETWNVDIGRATSDEWDSLTFSWGVPLPPGFQEDDEKYAGVVQ